MALVGEDAELLTKIQDTYVPFLKKLISFLEKSKKASPDNLNKLNAIYKIFTTAPPREQVETFHANQKKLENWYNKTQKEKQNEKKRGSKRTLDCSDDTDSSQGPCDSSSVPAKKSTFANSVSSEKSQNAKPSSPLTIPISQIKKEKITPTPILPKPQDQSLKTYSKTETLIQPPPVRQVVPNPNDPITFTCASCQFQTTDEGDFMKHARTDHRTDLSMWCKQCGKCFSNAGVLVSHIKERSCVKEDMIYRCGVKDCIFETVSGQTFVHHLRHCHKGSPFIFCVHCQKIFTLPHCLILHMQDDCPFKHKNRKNGSAGPLEEPTPPPPLHNLNNSNLSNANKNTTMSPKVVSVNTLNTSATKTPTPAIKPQVIVNTVTPPAALGRASAALTPAMFSSSGRSRGRGRGNRGRGRGRGRSRISDSSDSDDPDDPSWRPEEVLSETGLRRSGRWAKKINDVMNPEPSTSGVSTSSSSKSKSFGFTDMNTEMLNCPLCDFMAAFQSVLDDHYIAAHKVPNKNACIVCHLKFESSALFIEHFKDHIRGVLPNKLPSEDETKAPDTSKPQTPVATAAVPEPIVTATASIPEEDSPFKDMFDEIICPMNAANLAKPNDGGNGPVKIPYQAAIHDKNMKDSKLKKFQELKSPSDLKTMKIEEKLVHFFKCSLYNCPYTTDSRSEFVQHYATYHSGKRFYCCYCLKEYFTGENLANHMIFSHNKRLYQCNKCFYRAFSEMHVRIHIKNSHQTEAAAILACPEIPIPDGVVDTESKSEVLDTTWPFICSIGSCDFSTYDPKDFRHHNDTIHRTVSLFYCHYCKVDFISLKRLMNHYRLHGINVFQCNYCIHGSETKDEIMIHLCNVHADQPLKACVRGSYDDSTNIKNSNISIADHSQTAPVKQSVPSPASDSLDKVECVSNADSPMNLEEEFYQVVQNGCYPKYLQRLYSDVVCGIPFCNERSETIKDYFAHLKDVHDAVNYPCPYCPETSDVWEEFKNHVRCHSSKLYACGEFECNSYDIDKVKVQEYAKHHGHSNIGVIIVREQIDTTAGSEDLPLSPPFTLPEKYYTCLYCNYKSSNMNMMKNHMYKEMGYKRLSCQMCNQKCFSRKELKDHFLSEHEGDTSIPFSLDSNAELESSVKKFLISQGSTENIKLPIWCDACMKKFNNPVQMQSHLCICLQKKYHPYECSYCKKQFFNVLAVKYHTDAEHTSEPVQFSVLDNIVIENHIAKNLLKFRLKHLKEFFSRNGIKLDEVVTVTSVKVYSCSACSFEGSHKYTIQKHIEGKHNGESATVVKMLRDTNAGDSSNSHQDENSNDAFNKKRYHCGFCVKKFFFLRDTINHIQESHSDKVTKDYFYYYIPDTKLDFSPSDKRIFECAYCKSAKENLFSLKKHAELMHSEMEFKVKGIAQQYPKAYLACAYCYEKVDTIPDLKIHSASAHPCEVVKYLGEPSSTKVKRNESSDDLPNKKMKLGVDVFVCSHCGGAYSSEEQGIAHSRKSHSRLKVQLKVVSQSANDVKFLKCEFCHFMSEKEDLDKHLNAKHKMRVTCSYCSKRFEFASKLKEHHEVSHTDLPIKFVQETLGSALPRRFDPATDDEKSCESTDSFSIPQVMSHYGKKPEPVDLDSLTVCMDTDEGETSKLPASHLIQRVNIFPSIVLEDALKKKKVMD